MVLAQAPQRDSVIVTGTAAPVPLEEADRAVRAIDLTPLQRVLTQTPFELLRLDPSLDLRARAPNGVQTDLSIRGSTFGQTLVLLNGLRLNDAQTGHHNLNLPVPPEAIGRVEILRGSGSTLYGSDAVGGAVNFLTTRPEPGGSGFKEARLRAGLGNFGVNQQAAAFTFALGDVSQQVAMTRDFSSGFMPNRDYRNLSLSSITHAKSRLGWSDIVLAHNDRPFGADRFYGNFPSWERTKGWFASWRQELGPRTQAAYGFRRHTDLFVLFRDRPQVYTNRHATESHQVVIRRSDPLGRNAVLHYGGEGLHDAIDSNNLGNHSRGRGAGYATLDVRALRRFSFSAGFRQEVYTEGESQFNPTVSAGVWLSPEWKLRAGASRAFRLPTYTDLYYSDPANVGNPNLRPERAWNYEGGVDWFRGRWHAEATVFHRRERDGIDYVRASPDERWQATNFSRLRFTGVETSLDVRVGSSQWIDLRYTGIRGAREAVAGLASRYVFNFPEHNAAVAWQAAFANGWMARSRLSVLDRIGRDPYVLWDAGVARRVRAWTPFLQLTNLTSSRYEEIQGVVMPGRGVVGGIEWRGEW